MKNKFFTTVIPCFILGFGIGFIQLLALKAFFERDSAASLIGIIFIFIFIKIDHLLYEAINYFFKQEPAPFNYKKFSSGYYNLITRSGHAAEFVSVTGDKHVSANVPGIPSCRGMFWYGYDFNGNYKLVGESPLDLFMVRKGFWQVVHVFFLKLFGKYSV